MQKLPNLAEENGIDVCGIEFVTDAQGNYYAFDMNCNTNYNHGAERRDGRSAGTTGMGAIARFLSRRLDDLVTPKMLVWKSLKFFEFFFLISKKKKKKKKN